ncbi:MAG TPA: YbhB/YbcL family Raf kinase inhibitor-like protein [Allosphingosinicella sp.]|nr:YbhB/YbcL family Raf kinase inhibitor-like protein [Allosphingosinicella sp.]
MEAVTRLAVLALSLLALACSGEGSARTSRHALASARPETHAAATFAVTSPAFAAGSGVPLRHSAYGEGLSPPLAWSGLPERTRSLAIMMEDPDATSARPYVHWLAWNIDPAAGALPEGVPPAVELSQPVAIRQGRNTRGGIGYFGPRPHGSQPHHYHFQLFALDAPLVLPGGADREALLAAMSGHVLAQGELVGLFAQPRH